MDKSVMEPHWCVTDPASRIYPACSRGRIGIITNGFSSSYYGHMIEGASDYLMACGYQALAQCNLQSHVGELMACKSLMQMNCDGLIIHSDSLSDQELNTLFASHSNTVLLNRCLPDYRERCVYVDNVNGGQQAAHCLIANGHERIATVTGPRRFFETNDRTRGFHQELARHDLEPLLCIEGCFTESSGEHAMHGILDSDLNISAVFFHNDEMAFGAMTACRNRGISIPDDISIIGYDGLAACEYVTPKLSSVEQPLRQLGEHAARILCSLIMPSDVDDKPAFCEYKPVLAERETVSLPATYPDENVVLTQREYDCMTWTARGKTAWEISVILGISESTATFHLRNAGIKLKASNRTHAVAKAIQSGLITP